MGRETRLGLGTALVYPTLLAAVGDVAEPSWRADALGAVAAISATAALTVASGLVVALRMPSHSSQVRAA